MLKWNTLLIIMLVSFLEISQVQAQTEKEINHQTQSWISINNTFMLNDHLCVLADLHDRRTDFMDSESFYLVRAAVGYVTDSKQTLALGYGHMWTAPTTDNWHTDSNEDFIYQLYQFYSKINNVSILHRFRNEQRWQQIMADDSYTGEKRFSDRIRYLISFDIPVFNKKTWPSLSISDEVMIQFGEDYIYNTFDQNRLFIGIKQSITPKLCFDFGYMNVYQEKRSGYQYDSNQTLRLFFYYKSDFKSLFHLGKHS